MLQSHGVQAIVPYVIAVLLGLIMPASCSLCFWLVRKARLGFSLLSVLLLGADLLTIVLFLFPIIVGVCLSFGWFAAFVRCKLEVSIDEFPSYFWAFTVAINLTMWGTMFAGWQSSALLATGDDWFKTNIVWLLLYAMPSITVTLIWMLKLRSRDDLDNPIDL